MSDVLLVAGLALWLGILTSISPCPLATNIAAISFIGKRVNDIGHVMLSGMMYTIGRSAIYVVIGALLVASLLSVQDISLALQQYMNQVLGPILIIAGILLLGLIDFNVKGKGGGIVEKITSRFKADSPVSAMLLGAVFALSFCPVSAALFFGGLVPLSIKESSAVLLPLLYGIGTALPVVLFAILIALGTKSLSGIFEKLTKLESAARALTGIVFIAAGVFYCLKYIFHINLGF